jgi:hypothetical protein
MIEEASVPDEEQTERLRQEQRDRVRREGELAQTTDQPDERRAHERRADKADYLRQKLDEQADAPDEGG